MTVSLRLKGGQPQGNFLSSQAPGTYINAFLVLVRFALTFEFFQRWKGQQPPDVLFKNIEVVIQ